MTFLNLRPVLYCLDITQTLFFYNQVLGFTIDNRNDELGWASISKNTVVLMLSKPNDHTPFEHAKFTGSFYIIVEEIEPLWNKLKDQCKICYAIETFDWGMREFAIYDNNGYILQFGQEMN